MWVLLWHLASYTFRFDDDFAPLNRPSIPFHFSQAFFNQYTNQTLCIYLSVSLFNPRSLSLFKPLSLLSISFTFSLILASTLSTLFLNKSIFFFHQPYKIFIISFFDELHDMILFPYLSCPPRVLLTCTPLTTQLVRPNNS